ncbi:MAG: DUF2752 domain-containing protein [Tepidisphaeraceae bacterium]
MSDSVQPSSRPPPMPHVCRPHGKVYHVIILIIGLAVIGAALLAHVEADHRHIRFAGKTLPEMCVSRRFFGVECPGCGLTRSMTMLAHGYVRESIAMHRLGWLVALFIAGQIPYRVAALLGWTMSARYALWLLWGVLGALVVNWVVGLMG